MATISITPPTGTKEMKATRASDRADKNVKPLLRIVDYILNRVASTIPGNVQATQAPLDALADKALLAGFNEMPKLLQPYTICIREISREISCNCLGGGDEAAAKAILQSLSSYDSSYTKVVIALAIFAVQCGKLLLVPQLCPANPLAKSVAMLAQLPDIADTVKGDLCKLIKALLDVAKYISELHELPSQYVNPDTPAMQTIRTQHFPGAVDWTIRSIVACASQIMGHKASKTAKDLASLTEEGRKFSSYFMMQLNRYYIIIGKKVNEEYNRLEALINEHGPLQIFTDGMGNQLPFFHHSKSSLDFMDMLKGKTLFVLISDLDLSEKDLGVLIQLYQQSRDNLVASQREIVWLPVDSGSTPWNEVKKAQFRTLQSAMPWYSLCSPWSLDQAHIKYIKEVWQFKKLPLLMVVDPSGKARHPEDLHMIWTRWMKEDDIVMKDTISSIRFFIGGILEKNVAWVNEAKHICLYGGENIEWIRKFTTTAQKVAQAAGIQLEMLYVGKSNPGKKVEESNATIAKEKLSHTLADINGIQFFWLRLQSIWLSMEKHGDGMESNPVMREIAAILDFNSSNEGWAVISKEKFEGDESFEVTKAKGDTILQCLDEYDSWKYGVVKDGFVGALEKQHLLKLLPSKLCNHMILPMNTRSTDMVVILCRM